MPIDHPGDITDFKEDSIPRLRNTIDNITQQAVGVIYVASAPTASQVPLGKVVVYDDGTTRRIYVRTGKDGVGYAALTML